MRYPGSFRRLTSEVRRDSALTVGPGDVAITWLAIDRNDLGAAPAVGGTRLTAPAAGAYWATAYGQITSSLPNAQLWWRLNGVTVVGRQNQANPNRTQATLDVGRALRLAAGDFLELVANAGGGAARTFDFGLASLVRLG